MLKVGICGRNLPDLRRLLTDLPFRIVTRHPDLIISYGGDGALLGAERAFPGVPKLPLRDRRAAPKCPAHGERRVLDALLAGTLSETRLFKLAACARDTEFLAMNDVVIHNKVITSGVRYRVHVDGELYANCVVGDGLVAATPFGSTGYYRSITHSHFRTGIGLAFNNSTEPTHHVVLDDRSEIRVQVLRGPAVLLVDNAPERVPLARGESILIRRSAATAVVLGIDVFRCPACLRRRQENPHAA